MKRVLSLVLLALSVPGENAGAQTQTVEVEPVTCWWRTSVPAIRIGERFTVLLTCSLLQTDAARAVAEEGRLAPAAVQLPPFDVIDGTRAGDVITAGRRFIQFEYRLRALAEHVLGATVTIPALEIGYRVESRIGGGEALEGRERTYALPPLTMRVVSVVPDAADDIRDAPIPSFSDVDAVRTRAMTLRVLAGLALTLGGLAAVLALVRATRLRRVARQNVASPLPRAAILRAVRQELTRLAETVPATGWTPDATGRALAVARVVAAYEAKRPVAERDQVDGAASAGELVVAGRKRAVVVSAAVTRVDDAELADALNRLGAARYGRDAAGQQTSRDHLDHAVSVLLLRTDRLLAAQSWTERLWPR